MSAPGGDLDAGGPLPGHYDSRWPAEDGGPRRQLAPRARGLALAANETLGVTARPAFMANMVVLRAPGEVYLQGSTGPGPDNAAFVERIAPTTLEPLRRSPDLDAGGVWWPGGLVAHRNGFLYVTHGRFCHKLDADLRLIASRELPRACAYNSLLILSDGNLVMKNIVRDGSQRSYFTLLEPERLTVLGGEVEVPEPSIARIAKDVGADGELVYVVGDHTIYRYRYDAGTLARDERWSFRYRQLPDAEQSYGWDPVLASGHAWFMDGGEGVFTASLRGGGVASGPLHLVRVSLQDAGDAELFTPFGDPHGTITNPPLFDPSRRIAVAYDSGNARLGAFRYDGPGRFTRLWQHDMGASNHFVLYPDTGEIVVNDFTDDAGEHVAVLDITSGALRARVAIGSPIQSAVFQAPGFARDVYCCTFATLARVFPIAGSPG
jgi:hypothetical protein